MKEPAVSACPGLVVKGERYYSQARVPEELLAVWRQETGKLGPTYSVRLSARDRKAACREVKEQHWPRHYCMLDGLRAGPRTTITAEEADRIVATALHSRLSSDEDERLHGVDPNQAAARADWRAKLREDLRAAAAHGDVSGIAMAAEDWLQANNFELSQSSLGYKQYVRKFAKAMVEGNTIIDARDAGAFVDTPDAPPASRPAILEQPPGGPTLAACMEKWATKKKRPAGTLTAARAAVRDFTAYHGSPRAVSQYVRKEAIAWRDSLLKSEAKPLNPKTVNKKLSLLRAIVGDAIRDELDGLDESSRNPFKDTEVDEPRGAKARIGYSVDQLNSVFSSPVFAVGERPTGGREEAAYWLPLLALYTGARLEEIGQLRAVDVLQDGGVWYLYLRPEAGRIKTQVERRVPIHPVIQGLGLLTYAKEVVDEGEERLFPALSKRPDGKWTDSWSKWYGRYLRDVVKIGDRRITFHSFRHTFKDACREAGIDSVIQDALMGHSGGGEGKNYGSGLYPLRPLADAVAKIGYVGVPFLMCAEVAEHR